MNLKLKFNLGRKRFSGKTIAKVNNEALPAFIERQFADNEKFEAQRRQFLDMNTFLS